MPECSGTQGPSRLLCEIWKVLGMVLVQSVAGSALAAHWSGSHLVIQVTPVLNPVNRLLWSGEKFQSVSRTMGKYFLVREGRSCASVSRLLFWEEGETDTHEDRAGKGRGLLSPGCSIIVINSNLENLPVWRTHSVVTPSANGTWRGRGRPLRGRAADRCPSTLRQRPCCVDGVARGGWGCGVLSYREEEPGSACAPVPLEPGLDFPFGAGGKEGAVRRGGGERGLTWSFLPLPERCCFSSPGCQTCPMTHSVGVPRGKLFTPSAFTAPNTFLPQYKSTYCNALTKTCFARVPCICTVLLNLNAFLRTE